MNVSFLANHTDKLLKREMYKDGAEQLRKPRALRPVSIWGHDGQPCSKVSSERALRWEASGAGKEYQGVTLGERLGRLCHLQLPLWVTRGHCLTSSSRALALGYGAVFASWGQCFSFTHSARLSGILIGAFSSNSLCQARSAGPLSGRCLLLVTCHKVTKSPRAPTATGHVLSTACKDLHNLLPMHFPASSLVTPKGRSWTSHTNLPPWGQALQ